ncbi:ElyC/SanA/YdcF family protein [Daejeonella sp. H1SJ63]|jgi:uncharacterized SAM-binding protein YcdF (DUF218 family)|uniref:YdcF family protein n=1 Tax=Daejeonella sp. H1SJ63 TaxID=3034145 RepID=UPI0023EBE10E|nr:ElyC/SanA/YdcF family protein [Daejeonella sp. H1SJ63]
MFFILSKLLDFLISPTVLLLLLSITALLVKKQATRKKIIAAFAGLLLFFTNPLIINQLYGIWEIRNRTEAQKTYDAGIILSGFMGKDDIYNTLSFGTGADRLTEGLMLYKKGRIKKIIISGGSGSLIDDTRESALAKDFLVRYCAVPDSAVLIDSISRNTYENAVESKKIVESEGIKSSVMITSAWHMRRAQACFKKVGLNVAVHPIDGMYREQSYNPANTIIPDTENINRWEVLLHEIAGILVYKLKGYN